MVERCAKNTIGEVEGQRALSLSKGSLHLWIKGVDIYHGKRGAPLTHPHVVAGSAVAESPICLRPLVWCR